MSQTKIEKRLFAIVFFAILAIIMLWADLNNIINCISTYNYNVYVCETNLKTALFFCSIACWMFFLMTSVVSLCLINEEKP
jgi:hypothetical protein